MQEKVGDTVDPAIIQAILQLPAETVQNLYAPSAEVAESIMDEQIKPRYNRKHVCRTFGRIVFDTIHNKVGNPHRYLRF